MLTWVGSGSWEKSMTSWVWGRTPVGVRLIWHVFHFDSHLVIQVPLSTGKMEGQHLGSERVFGFIGNHKDCYAPKAVRTSSYIAGRLPLAIWLRSILGIKTSTHMSPRKVSRGAFFPPCPFPKATTFQNVSFQGREANKPEEWGWKEQRTEDWESNVL